MEISFACHDSTLTNATLYEDESEKLYAHLNVAGQPNRVYSPVIATTSGFRVPTAPGAHYYATMANAININQLKRKMTLNLDESAAGNKTSVIKKGKQMLMTPGNLEVLQSPDLHMLKLASPELERLIVSNLGSGMGATPTPTSIFYPKNVSEEQENYAKGFTEALERMQRNQGQVNELQAVAVTTMANGVTGASQYDSSSGDEDYSSSNQDSNPPDDNMNNSFKHYTVVGNQMYQQPMPMTTAAATVPINPNNMHLSHHRLPDYTLPSSTAPATLHSHPQQHFNNNPPPPFNNIVIKEEPLQTVPSITSSSPSSPLSPLQAGLSPIDMADQERIKLERKRQRNRLAASKCRRRKLERIARLEDKVKGLKNENNNLLTVLEKLRGNVSTLKEQVMLHVNSGCSIMVSNGMQL